MGYGEYGGNGSVIWKVEHEEQRRKRTKKIHLDKFFPPEHPEADHVRVKHDNVEGRDAIASGDIGGGTGNFTVRLRYASQAAADAALAQVTVQPGQGGFYVEILVPAITTRTDFDVDLPLEVKVQW